MTAVLECIESSTRGRFITSDFHCASNINTARPIIRVCGHCDQVNLLLRAVISALDCY